MSLLQADVYRAEASLLFRDPGFDDRVLGNTSVAVQDPEREAATNVQLVSLDEVAQRTVEHLPYTVDEQTVVNDVDVRPEGQSNVVTIEASANSPGNAASLANTFAESFIEFRRDADREKINDAIALVEDDLKDNDLADSEVRALEAQISKLRTLGALQTGNAELVEKAQPPTDRAAPRPVAASITAGIVGLVLGLLLALLVDRLDRRIREPDELREIFDRPILTSVPFSDELASSATNAAEVTDPGFDHGGSEAFAMLLTQMRYFNVDTTLRTVLITSPEAGEGKTTVAQRLAYASALSGHRTLLVEVDLHRSVVASRLGLDASQGLTSVLSDQCALKAAIQTVGNGPPLLEVLPSGPPAPNPAQLLDSSAMADLIGEVAGGWDLVVFDGPPILLVSDTIPLIPKVDGVIVVGAVAQTARSHARLLATQLQGLRAHVLGLVVNRVRNRGGYGYYAYGSRSEADRGKSWFRLPKRRA